MHRLDLEIIEKASEYCPKWGGCLISLSHCCNALELKGNYLIVEPTEMSHDVPCSNCVKVDTHYVCLCKLRKEIYKKHEM